MESGALTFQLIDDDGDDLPGRWSYEWSGRDPLELVIYVVTELSGKPWKWSSQRKGRALLSAKRCRALSIRTGKTLRAANRRLTSAAIARIVANETLRPGHRPPDTSVIADILAGRREADWDAGPQETTPAMLRALRKALKAAVECEGGLQIVWGDRD